MNNKSERALFVGRGAAAAVLVALASTSCGNDPDIKSLSDMNAAKGTAAYAQFCDKPLTCSSTAANACGRVFTHIGNACMTRADAMSSTEPAAKMRQVTGMAEGAFRKAVEVSAGADRLIATEGVAESLELRRGFSSNADADAINVSLGAAAQQLRAMPGGVDRAGYYDAGVRQYVAMRVATVSSAQCSDLRAAATMLPAAPAGAEFATRVGQRRAQIDQALVTRGCP